MPSVETDFIQSRNLLSGSQRRARFLLAAWNSADLSRLEAALDMTAIRAAATYGEQERMEMVEEVEYTLRNWLDSSARRNEVELLASLKILRHLTGCEEPLRVPELARQAYN
jgi:hypothetical protein